MIAHNETRRANPDELLEGLQIAGAEVKARNQIKCPFHEDKHPSGGIYHDADGVWRYKCHAASCGFCGDIFDVQARAEGRPVEEVLKEGSSLPPRVKRAPADPPPAPRPLNDIVAGLGQRHRATYEYTDPTTGKVDLVVIRHEAPGGGKGFWQARPVDGGYILQAPPDPKPLYNRTRLAKADRVVIVEGEKCVHALAGAQIVATTSPGGAGKAAHADWTPVAGKKVYLWPDWDPPDDDGKRGGVEHMQSVATILETLMPRPKVYWIDPGKLGLKDKEDVADYLAPYQELGTEAQWAIIDGLLKQADQLGPFREISELIEETLAGRHRALRWPWANLSEYSQALQPGTVTVLCGGEGAGKTFMLLEAAQFWYAQGLRIVIYELEESRQYHLWRVLAQREGNAKLYVPEWMEAHPDEVRAARDRQQDFLAGFGECLSQAPEETLTLTTLVEWIKHQAAEGVEIIAIDPITAATANDKPWLADRQFVMAAKAAIRDTQTRLILVTHPRKGGNPKVGLHDMAGGAAYARFVQTVLWLDMMAPPKMLTVRTSMGDSSFEVERVLWLRKTRNGQGSGMQLAYTFDRQTLRFHEHGIIQKGRD